MAYHGGYSSGPIVQGRGEARQEAEKESDQVRIRWI